MSIYEFNKLGDYNKPSKQVKLIDDIKHFLKSPVMRNGYGLNISELDYNDTKVMQEAYAKLKKFVTGLLNVKNCTCKVNKEVNPDNDEGGYLYTLQMDISYEISASEYKSLNLKIDLES